MGRRKIEIRAIKDDRNRSVTFLKRKGGLFKKAHELSVLCSVDVAVIIFGHNKKLYEFSSGDINETLGRYRYYGPPHEHKGPHDFKNKGGGDDDEEDEEEDDTPMHNDDSMPPQQHSLMAQHLQHHTSFPHIRGPGSSASPPMPNGLFQPRTSTPGPSSVGSRPSSRNTVRRPSSNLVPMQHPHMTPPQPQNGFAYVPNPPIYNPQANVAPPHHPSPQPMQYQQFPPQSRTPQPQHQPLPQARPPYIAEPQHTPQPPPPRPDSLAPPAQPIPRSSPQPQHQEFKQPENMTPPQIKQLSSKSRSIFTPIDDGGSILAQHFFGGPEPPKRDIKTELSPNLKVPHRTVTAPSSSRPTPPPPARSSKTSPFRPPARSDTNGSKNGARPKLNLTIPSESSDNEDSASPQARSALNSANPAREGHHGIVLPPPSPSASAIPSAGATGPPNPFARPAPTSNQNGAYGDSRNANNLETPVSALPSRYMDRELLASPGGIFGSSWDTYNSHTLPSPNMATPAEARIPSGAWGRVDLDNDKRKADEIMGGEGKRLRT